MGIEENIAEFLNDPERRKRLVDASEKALEEKITENFKWSLPSSVSDVCSDFVTNEIAPAVHAHLLKNKGVILKAAIAAADEIGEKLAVALVEKAAKNLTNSYDVKKVVDGLFN